MEHLSTRPVYSLNGKDSFNLYDLISTDLTLDLNSATGFKEITLTKPWRTDIKDDCEKTTTDMDSLCKELLSLIEESIIKLWNPADKHLVFISGGADSRIICYTLKKLEQIKGKDWLGEVKFLTRFEGMNGSNSTDSIVIVEAVMKKLGWEFLKATTMDFSPYLIPNAYHPFEMSFYSPLSSDYKELKTWVAVSGNYGGEQTQYPYFKGLTNDRYGDMMRWMDVAYAFAFHTFKDFLQPYLYKPYMYTCFKIHESLFKSEEKDIKHQDHIRRRMLDMLGDTLPTYFGHDYSTVTSSQNFEYTKTAQIFWNNSQFRKDFSEQLGSYKDMQIENVWNKKDIKSKLFGLAMTYDFGGR